MKKIPKRYLLVLSLILSLGLSGLIAPSAQPIQARRYQDHSVYQHRTYQHKTYQRRTYQKRVYRRHTHPRRTLSTQNLPEARTSPPLSYQTLHCDCC